MSLIDDLAAADVDLDRLKLSDLGIDIMSLGWTETEEGVLTEVIRENDKYSMNKEEVEWLARVLDSCRLVHSTAVARLYVCKEGSNTWEYNGLYGAVAIVTEADLRMACSHFIRLIDLGGFNPNSSVILNQEIYPNFEYKKLTPWFHAFEMTKFVAGISFAKEEAAEKFYEKVQHCINTDATEMVEDDMDAKEKTYLMVGENNFRQVNDGMSVGVAKKYAAGGITDGTEVKWSKKGNLPPELKAALGIVDEAPSATPSSPNTGSGNVIDLLQDPNVRKNTTSDTKISDGVSMQWSKNKTTLIGGKEEIIKREQAEKKQLKKSKGLLGKLKRK